MNVATSEEMPPAPHAVTTPPLNRMVMAILALAGIVISGYMLLYKVGVIPTVACGTGSCEAVQASPWASFAGVPVPLIGVLGYVAIFAVAMLGIQPAFIHHRAVSVGLLGLGAGAFGFSMYLTSVEAFLIHAWCRWCIASAIAASLLFLFALVEWPRLRRSADG